MSYILDALKRAETAKGEGESILPLNYSAVSPKKSLRRLVIPCLIVLLFLGWIGIYFKPPAVPIIPPKPKETAKAISFPVPTVPKPETTAPPAESKPEPDIPKQSIIPQLIEMPPAFQQSIPPLQFKGHFYSTDPQKGSVLIGEKIYPVGSEIAPGIVLKTVTPTGVILNTHHTQFRIEILGNWVY